METDSHYAFSTYVEQLIKNSQESLGIHSVFYGDQTQLPGTPVVCIEPDVKNITLAGMTRKVDLEFRTYILVYSALVDTVETNRRAADQLAEQIETLLNSDARCGGLVIHSMVEELSSGYSTKSGTIVRANRILFTGRSVSRLPAS